MAKVKSAYAAKLGQPVGNFKFLWNGTRVEDDHTPASVGTVLVTTLRGVWAMQHADAIVLRWYL
jgi:hypothetical protein